MGSSLARIITFLRKRKWLILGITVCAGVATGLVTRKLPPVYRATASIILDLSMPQYLGAGMTDVMDGEATWWRSRETMETEFRTLRSRSQNAAVAQALCDQQINGAPALKVILPNTDCKSTEDFAKAAPMLQGMLDVAPVRDSRVVELTVRSRDPQFAAMLANTAANVYSKENLQRRLTNSAGATSWLGDEYHQLVTELRRAEETLIQFKQKNNIVAVSLEDDQNELSARRRKLAEELNTVEVKLIGLKGEREQFESFGKNDPVSEMNPALAKNEVAQKLKEL